MDADRPPSDRPATATTGSGTPPDAARGTRGERPPDRGHGRRAARAAGRRGPHPAAAGAAAHPPRRDRHGPGALRGRQGLPTTGWRMAKYYLGDARLPPSGGRRRSLLRLLGPVVVLLTVPLFASGIALLLVPHSLRQETMFVHKASFVLWFGAMAIHVLGHLLETSRLAPADLVARTRSQVRGAGARLWAQAACLVARHRPRHRHGTDRRPLARRAAGSGAEPRRWATMAGDEGTGGRGRPRAALGARARPARARLRRRRRGGRHRRPLLPAVLHLRGGGPRLAHARARRASRWSGPCGPAATARRCSC